MSGEELKKKLEGLDISQAKLADLMGVFPQSFNKTLQADDVKSGFIEKLCRVLNKDLSFFYNISASSSDEELTNLRHQVQELNEENNRLKEELRLKEDPEHPKKESEMYRLWMEHMRITERMQELYQKEKER